MRFLCVSDVHGHVAALRAVLDHAGMLGGFHQLVVCGDLLFPGPEPLETWKLLVKHQALCVQGIGDRALSTVNPDTIVPIDEGQRERLERLRRMRVDLGELILARLAKLPPLARVPIESGNELVVVHGSPKDPTEPITADMTDEEIDSLIADDPCDILVCGASHVPFDRVVSDVRVLGVGSVGEAPGGGVAHGTLLETNDIGARVEQFAVPI